MRIVLIDQRQRNTAELVRHVQLGQQNELLAGVEQDPAFVRAQAALDHLALLVVEAPVHQPAQGPTAGRLHSGAVLGVAIDGHGHLRRPQRAPVQARHAGIGVRLIMIRIAIRLHMQFHHRDACQDDTGFQMHHGAQRAGFVAGEGGPQVGVVQCHPRVAVQEPGRHAHFQRIDDRAFALITVVAEVLPVQFVVRVHHQLVTVGDGGAGAQVMVYKPAVIPAWVRTNDVEIAPFVIAAGDSQLVDDSAPRRRSVCGSLNAGIAQAQQ
ncbi:hypothetical protein A167_00753 [Alcanivorax sp. S71-1-4]|nr:hypothetical protein A167_00753 [Alcanivorax sp. S71-1-4]